MNRLEDLRRFYGIVDALAKRVGGTRLLRECHGRLVWPQRGVYFIFEDGEQRTDSGKGLRIVRVGTHALKTGSRSTLWGRLSAHRGQQKSGGGNHRASVFRLLVGDALQARYPDDGVRTWGHGSSAPSAIRQEEQPLEEHVSEVLGTMSVLWVAVDDEPGPDSMRGTIERNAIALLSNWNKPPLDPPSTAWLGWHSTRERVQQSGLWNNNHVDMAYDPSFLDDLARIVTL